MAQAQQPNILLVTTDQQRYDATGMTGPSFLRTPHFDHLCREGIHFRRAYADCPLCVPSRVSIMTGKSVFAHGYNGNGPTSQCMGRTETLPAALRSAGYQTAAVGKMHFGPERNRHGFDEMILPADYYLQMLHSGQPLGPMRHGLGQNELYPTLATLPEAMTLTNWIADQCLSYIRFRRDPTLPFFLWCSFSKPHPPLDPPEPYYSMYRDCRIPEPILSDWSSDANAPLAVKGFRQQNSYDLIPPEVIRAARAAYYGLITQIDYNMGRVFAALQDLGLFNDTLILYTSDHGEFLGDHRCGSKVFFLEPSARIPFVLRLPKSFPDRRHGTSVDGLVSLADVMPTLLAAVGAVGPAGMDGLDVLAVARQQAPPRQYIEATGSGSRDYLAITDGRWKYIYYFEGAQEQLFDLASDPLEKQELSRAPACADVKAALREELLARQRRRNSKFLQDGQFIVQPPSPESEADRRNRAWPGYHSEHFDVDVRH